jgi:hypothetical protein
MTEAKYLGTWTWRTEPALKMLMQFSVSKIMPVEASI